MAKIKCATGATPILNEHNGYTFQPNNYGQSMFPAQKNDRYRRPRQLEAMAYNQRCVKAWRDLSVASQTAWESFAATYPQPTKSDASVFLTGYQLFVKRNFYCLQNQGVNEDLITDPILESLPNPDFSIQITADKNIIDFTSQYVKYFGIIPEPGLFVICKILPYAEKSGQFFTPFIATLEVLNVYVDGLFGSFSFVGNLPGIIFSVFLSKPFRESQQYPGTKYRYMGCFKPSTFIELTDTPSSYAGQAGKVPAVNAGENGLEFITAGGGGTVQSEMSVTGDGTSADKLRLVNDSNTPGNSKLYGTNSGGTKGWYSIPSSFDSRIINVWAILSSSSDYVGVKVANYEPDALSGEFQITVFNPSVAIQGTIFGQFSYDKNATPKFLVSVYHNSASSVISLVSINLISSRPYLSFYNYKLNAGFSLRGTIIEY